MDTTPYVGKTILQLDSLTGAIDLENSYMEVHVAGRADSQRLKLATMTAQGKSAYEVAVEAGFVGTQAQWLQSLVGVNGNSAFEVAQLNGFTGTQAQWLESLVGAAGTDGNDGKDGQDGADGKSAFEVAQEQGFAGDVTQWLTELVGADGADGKSAFDVAQEEGFAGSVEDWLASLKGEKGEQGKSAYEVFVEQTGSGLSEVEWLDSLVGEKGEKGEDGTIGVDGKSAFDIAVDNGFTGTQEEWLESLVGADGVSAYQVAVDNGFVGDESAWLLTIVGPQGPEGEQGPQGEQGIQGEEGKSAFDAAVENGFTGDEQSWLESLKGEQGERGAKGEAGKDGVDGASAYDVAVASGYTGTLSDWLQSIKGAKGDQGDEGKSAYQVAVVNGYVGDEQSWLNTLKGEDGADGLSAVFGKVQGVLDSTDDLPDASEFEESDCFFIEGHVHMVVNGDWNDMGTFEGPAGRDGTGIYILGELANTSLLPESSDIVGNTWLIGKTMWVWNGDRWQEQGQEGLRGEQGPKGDKGDKGQSALEVLRAEYPEVTTTAAMAAFLKGEKGDKGDIGLSFVVDRTEMTGYELPPIYEPNHGILIGTEEDGYDFHVYTVEGGWVNMGNNTGPQGPVGVQGPQGERGPRGYSATPKGTMGSIEDLPDEGNQIGECYTVEGILFGWDGDQWVDMGDISGPVGPEGPVGPIGAGLNAKGSLASTEDLDSVSDPNTGDAYEIGGRIYVYGTDGFKDMGQWRGAKGDKGAQGDQGPQGEQGPAGEDGEDGAQGPAGKSNYDLALEDGFEGTLTEWIASIGGRNGLSAYEIALEDGFDGSVEEWLESLVGPAGKDAYDAAVSLGFEGNVAAWLDSLKGQDGADGSAINFLGTVTSLPAEAVKADAVRFEGEFYIHNGTAWVNAGAFGVDGKNAYQIALDNGYVGDEQSWLQSLVGEQGVQGEQGETGPAGPSTYEEAVEEGLFTGTLAEFIESQRGLPGRDVLQAAIDEGLLGEEAVFADFVEIIKGPQGEEGPIGPEGPQGKGMTIGGYFPNEAALPTINQASPDLSTIYIAEVGGENHAFIAADNGSGGYAYQDLGNIIGIQGVQGPQGVRGLQGQRGEKGEKGDKGIIWIALPRDPSAVDGRQDDYFFNTASQEFFVKTSAITWASLGHIGGGNLNRPNVDGKIKGFLNEAWEDLPEIIQEVPNENVFKGLKNQAWADLPTHVQQVPSDDGVYQLKNGEWEKFDTYTLAAVAVARSGSNYDVDLNNGRVFRVTNNGAGTIRILNLPASNRATTIVVKIYGKTGALNWTLPTGNIRWFENEAPTLDNDITTVVLSWDGNEMVGNRPN